MYISLHVKCLLFCPIFNQSFILPTDCSKHHRHPRTTDGNPFTMSTVPRRRSGGIDIMQRIVALHDFANTLTNGKTIVTVFTLCDVRQHTDVMLFIPCIFLQSVYHPTYALCGKPFITSGLYQHLHVSAPRFHPQGVITKATCQSQIDCEMCVHVCHVLFWNVLKRFQNLVLEVYIISCEFRLTTLE